MRIGVISDTHIPTRSKKIPNEISDIFKSVDYIFHAGDIQDLSVLDTLIKIAPVKAVSGNTDPVEVQKLLNSKEIITLDGIAFGITHGDGRSGSTPDRAFRTFIDDEVDCIVFGHGHIPLVETRDGILLFNPGSPTDKRRQPKFSCGMLETHRNSVTGRIIYL